MWIVAGLLLGLVLVTALVGFHSGPHTHVAAAVLGLAAAGWLLYMASDGRSAPLLWVLFGADLAISLGIGVMGWVAIHRPGAEGRMAPGRLEGAEGIAVTGLSPEGVVRVRGEDWSATCVNGTVPAGSRVQVLHGGVRLEVWGEHPEEAAHPQPQVVARTEPGDAVPPERAEAPRSQPEPRRGSTQAEREWSP